MLLFSAVTDWSADRIASALDRRGIAYRWLDPATFPMNAGLTATLGGGWRGRYGPDDGVSSGAEDRATGPVVGGGEVRWDEVTAVLYRRPRDFQFPESMSAPERSFARAQARVAIGGILASLPVVWVNHPSALADAEYKPRQLALAERVGLAVPPTLITTCAEDVRRFAGEHGPLITKPLAMPLVAENGGQTIATTCRVDDAQLAELGGVEVTAHLFQPELVKDYEVRLIVVGVHLFAVAIHAHSPAARLDWRTDYDALSYTVIETPPAIEDGVRRFLRDSGLTYGAFDFVVDPHGRWWFLECNGGGQWGWLAEECRLPIADAFVDTLTSEVTA
ncbi:hypothetical protein [Pseudonocardia sp. HH130630-07]|uniref:hypothetical protein n=1 Tax=Pseudonocardia sp. HH130630-07 TaxID=1690815 RepID=UPI001E3D4D89|nr:hypothetical protein [Pseudonocardia sp. HH130630-07]